MSLLLKFLVSYQSGTPTVMDATCSDVQNNVQYNCTAEFTVDIIPSVEIIQSVNVTVRGPYGSNSSVMEIEQSTYVYTINDCTFSDIVIMFEKFSFDYMLYSKLRLSL